MTTNYKNFFVLFLLFGCLPLEYAFVLKREGDFNGDNQWVESSSREMREYEDASLIDTSYLDDREQDFVLDRNGDYSEDDTIREYQVNTDEQPIEKFPGDYTSNDRYRQHDNSLRRAVVSSLRQHERTANVPKKQSRKIARNTASMVRLGFNTLMDNEREYGDSHIYKSNIPDVNSRDKRHLGSLGGGPSRYSRYYSPSRYLIKLHDGKLDSLNKESINSTKHRHLQNQKAKLKLLKLMG